MIVGDEIIIIKRIASISLWPGDRYRISCIVQGVPMVFIEHFGSDFILDPDEYRLLSPLELLAEVAE